MQKIYLFKGINKEEIRIYAELIKIKKGMISDFELYQDNESLYWLRVCVRHTNEEVLLPISNIEELEEYFRLDSFD